MRLAIIYERQGKYEKAIEVCNEAIKRDQDDGTKGGFDGRKNVSEKNWMSEGPFIVKQGNGQMSNALRRETPQSALKHYPVLKTSSSFSISHESGKYNYGHSL